VEERHTAKFWVRRLGAIVDVVHIGALARQRVEPITVCISHGHTHIDILSHRRRGTQQEKKPSKKKYAPVISLVWDGTDPIRPGK
jgi:hypothetical protein